ncbi:MAG: hypothetical protein K0R82_944, partial [Flavipsychrobacter sp.]|nr:hypothetical protein [Flavipsychrobacter sp.]
MATGIGDLNFANALVLYPNPAQNILTIRSASAPIHNIKVYNTVGALVLDTSVNDKKNATLDVT